MPAAGVRSTTKRSRSPVPSSRPGSEPQRRQRIQPSSRPLAPFVEAGTIVSDRRHASSLPPMYPGQYAIDHPDRLAIIMAGSGQTVTYAEFEARANRFAHLLRDAGL